MKFKIQQKSQSIFRDVRHFLLKLCIVILLKFFIVMCIIFYAVQFKCCFCRKILILLKQKNKGTKNYFCRLHFAIASYFDVNITVINIFSLNF